MRTRRQLVSAIFMPLVFGGVGLSNVARQPRFQAFHTVDILQLLASGMCFGVALFAVVSLVRGPRRP